ncbi:sugar transferase [Patulibacter sp. SYSU D01012]|uniref:sugar transferase n=1 Tax=Patulibacter sp. SYSU D01012 TaxID=2817381 RepID=UPI0032C0CAAB
MRQASPSPDAVPDRPEPTERPVAGAPSLVANGTSAADRDGLPTLGSVSPLRPATDIRAKRPPALLFLLRVETMRKVLRVLGLMAVDAASVWAAIFTALALKALWLGSFDAGWHAHQAREIAPFTILVVLLNFARMGLYGRRHERQGLGRIVTGLFQVMVVSMVFVLINGQRDQFSSYYIFYGSAAVGIVYIAVLRQAYEIVSGRLLRSSGQQRRAVLVGTAEHSDAIASALADDVDTAIRVTGVLTLDADAPPPQHAPSLGTADDLPALLASGAIDEVIITDPAFPEELALDIVDQAHRQGVHVRVAPSTMEILVHRAEFLPGQTVPLFELKPPVSEGIDFAIKRTFDLVMSTFILVLLSPVLLAMAVAIRVSSPGPVIYRSRRPGVGGVPFDCLKFRTMYADADRRQSELEELNEAGGAIFKMRNDPRVTPVGKLLRRLSLDELPQLLNVLRGEMSLVGPRPLPQRDYDRLEEWHKKRYLVLPGVTGLWQVSGRSDLEFDDMVRLDFLYLERWSVSLDLQILVKTIPAVFGRRGAF